MKLARVHQDPAAYAKLMQSKRTKILPQYAVKLYNETMMTASALLDEKHYDLHEVPIDELPTRHAKVS